MSQNNTTVTLSFEFYPPKTEAGKAKLPTTAAALAELRPAYFSCTFGAGGSTQQGTQETVKTIRETTNVMAAPHLSCISSNKADIKQMLESYLGHGIDRIVALRGDIPSGTGKAHGELAYACHLVNFIRENTGDYFHIEVAAYPEPHPEAANFQADFANFKRKVAAGANSAITQYFYNTDAYFYFLDSCADAGINIPIVPGIMPINNYDNLKRFSHICGAELPLWLRRRLDGFGDDTASIKAFGLDFVTQLCEKLIQGGAPGLHFYTLNLLEPSRTIAQRLGF